MPTHVCPWWFAYTFDNPLRRLFHNPEKLFGAYVRPGDWALDIGCGMGFFSLGLARLVGTQGKVVSVDLQAKMIAVLTRRATKAGLVDRLDPRLCRADDLAIHDLAGRIGFVNCFWMVHEVPDQHWLFKQILEALAPGGRCFIAEPRMHVNDDSLNKTLEIAAEAGLKVIDRPKVSLSLAVVLSR